MSTSTTVIKCSLPPHGTLSFASFDAYEVHYAQTHTNRCSDCHRNLPDPHFLLLHIAENHDPISAARRARGEKTYACLVPTCDRLTSSPHKRRLHCIDKHHFPRNYDFFVVNDGIDRRSSMLRSSNHRRRSSTITSTGSTANSANSTSASAVANGRRRSDGVGDANDDAMDGVTGSAGAEEGADEVVSRAPLKLRGRGGFTHPSRGRGSRSSLSAPAPSSVSTAQPAPAPATEREDTPDPMDGLASSMSALRFVPHSLYARGRGRGTARGR